MAFRRRFRKRVYKKRPAIGKRAGRAVKSIVKKTLRSTAEWKHHYTIVDAASSTTAVAYDLTAVTQGDTGTARDGNMIQVSSIKMMYQWVNGEDNNQMRLIIFQWHPDTTPVNSNILDTSQGMGCMYHYNTNDKANYKILYDRTHQVNVNFTGQTWYTPVITKKIRIPRMKVQYGSGTVGTNKVYAMIVTDSGVVPHPSIYLFAKLNYRDF